MLIISWNLGSALSEFFFTPCQQANFNFYWNFMRNNFSLVVPSAKQLALLLTETFAVKLIPRSKFEGLGAGFQLRRPPPDGFCSDRSSKNREDIKNQRRPQNTCWWPPAYQAWTRHRAGQLGHWWLCHFWQQGFAFILDKFQVGGLQTLSKVHNCLKAEQERAGDDLKRNNFEIIFRRRESTLSLQEKTKKWRNLYSFLTL